VLVGPATADDAGAYELDGRALVATADFITPVCDDPRRYGRVAAANSLSDVYAMGGRPLFALNLCCFPQDGVPQGVLGAILEGGAEILGEAGTALLGGHSVTDQELKYGLAVVGVADPARLLTNAAATPGDRLILTKPLGTGVLINAFKFDRLDEEGLEPALREMERLNAEASRLALAHGANAATDITGFGFAGHALEMARASGVGVRVRFSEIPVYEPFYDLVARNVTTGCTEANFNNIASFFEDLIDLGKAQREVLVDPQTSGGLLISIPAEPAESLLEQLREAGHQAAAIGAVLPGPPRFEVA
jgi:selenide,water dikinase